MFQFVYWLRALAAVMITNAHYADIWPISALAFGGHFGNCIYFFLSGFCLYNVHDSFLKWYAKRIVRIYPPLWIAAIFNLVCGFWEANGLMAYVHCLIYPTWYHFISSIMLLYVVFYIIRFVQSKRHIDTRWFLLAFLIIFILAYIFMFDKSYYHIDDINENWCRFMFIESMLFGAYIRENYDKIGDKISLWNVVSFICLGMLYFICKKILTSVADASMIQCVLPIIVVLFILSLNILFIKIEKKRIFEAANKSIKALVTFIAGISLEVYLVQYVIIDHFSGLAFPINFVVVTGLILLCAYITNRAARFIQMPLDRLLYAGAKQKENAK